MNSTRSTGVRSTYTNFVFAAACCASLLMQACASSRDTAAALPCDVAEVFDEHCVKCHGSELLFGAPMALVSPGDLEAPAASDESVAVHELLLERMRSETRQMPPPPNSAVPEAQIALIEAWLEDGRPRRSAGEQCAEPSDRDGGAMTDPVDDAPDDCVDFYELRAHGKAEAGDTSPFAVPSALDEKNGNLYQCFYFDLPYDGKVQGLWFAPLVDDARVVHHWNLWANDGSGGPIGEEGGMDPCNANQAGSYMVAGWAPGGAVSNFPDTMGLELPSGPDARFLLEVHYYNGANLEDLRDRSGVRFCTAPVDTRPEMAAIHQLGTEGICLPSGQRTEVSGMCTPREDMGDIHVINVSPHMHKLGVRQEVEIIREDGTREMLHEGAFAFDSQISYPVDAIIHPGDRLETRCTYENTTSDAVPFGEQTQEEMCYAYLTAWPAGSLTMTGDTAAGAASNLNRCVDLLSVLESCNGFADAPF